MTGGKRILVIDDEIGMCKTLNDILTDQGYRVEVAYNGREGLAKAAHHPPALVITAYGGGRTAEELRANIGDIRLT